MLDEIDAGDLRAESTVGLRHTAQRKGSAAVRLANGEYTRTPEDGPEIRGLLSAMSAAEVQVAAASGVVASWWARFPLGTVVRPKQRWLFSGLTRGEEWTRLVEITGDPDPTSRIHVLAQAVDVALNR